MSNLTLHDLTFQEVQIPQPLTRVVSLVPSITETVFALGGGDRLIGRTRYCISPDPEVREIEKVGGTKDPNLERIIELAPQLVLVKKEENRREDIDRLREAGLNVFVDQITTVEESLSFIHRIGQMFDLEADGLVSEGTRKLVQARERLRELNEQNQLRRNPRASVRPRTAAFIWKDPWMVVAHDTYIGDLINELGGLNLFAAGPERYQEVTPEEVAALDPEVMLFPSEPYKFTEGDLDFWRKNFPLVPAVKSGNLVLCHGQDLVWSGVRTVQALDRLSDLIALP
ncbi:MAG: ABC transporter substrate-binding protein [Planctomycetota bacterium]|jgi:ABC-type Fe3+-hydroxamate transport system substrate-binding protein